MRNSLLNLEIFSMYGRGKDEILAGRIILDTKSTMDYSSFLFLSASPSLILLGLVKKVTIHTPSRVAWRGANQYTSRWSNVE